MSAPVTQPTAATGPAPSPVSTASKLLYVKAGLALLGIASAFLIRDAVDQAAAVEPGLGAGFTDMLTGLGVAMTVLGGLLAAAVWATLAVFTGRGHGWARIVTTVFAGLGILFALFSLLGLVLSATVPGASSVAPGLTLVSALLALVLDVAIIVLLFRPRSNAWFREVGATRAALAGRPY